MRIAVVGVGGVGGYFGARLAQSGHDVTFIARGAHLDALRRDGLRLESPKGDVELSVDATDDATSVGPVDAVLVAVKTWQLSDAFDVIRPMLGPATAVLPLLNGVEAPGALAAALGAGHALGGLCRIVSHLDGPGRIKHIGVEPFVSFGELDNAPTDRVESLREAFDRAPGLDVGVPADVVAAMWQKFLFIAPTSGVGAAARAPFGVMREMRQIRDLIARAMRETLQVGKASGVDLSDELIPAALDLLDAAPAGGTTSMQRDIESGRPSELEAQTGAVVRIGERRAIATPVNDFLYRVLLPQEQRARGALEF
ncbi:MAG: 2-dehydropantoate 2-reductase [Vicinamibacterales bacterium]|nr:2-dehydropantoate 2-reductase [Vicinamibacterales bacterium]